MGTCQNVHGHTRRKDTYERTQLKYAIHPNIKGEESITLIVISMYFYLTPYTPHYVV